MFGWTPCALYDLHLDEATANILLHLLSIYRYFFFFFPGWIIWNLVADFIPKGFSRDPEKKKILCNYSNMITPTRWNSHSLILADSGSYKFSLINPKMSFGAGFILCWSKTQLEFMLCIWSLGLYSLFCNYPSWPSPPTPTIVLTPWLFEEPRPLVHVLDLSDCFPPVLFPVLSLAPAFPINWKSVLRIRFVSDSVFQQECVVTMLGAPCCIMTRSSMRLSHHWWWLSDHLLKTVISDLSLVKIHAPFLLSKYIASHLWVMSWHQVYILFSATSYLMVYAAIDLLARISHLLGVAKW